MIDEPRLDAYRRIVDEEHQRNEDIDEIAQQIEDLQRERKLRQSAREGGTMDAKLESTLDYGNAVEPDPFAGLSNRELEELELSPHEIDFTALSQEQQIRYWSLLSPGEKLCMVRLHLQADREEIARRLQLPAKILRHLEEDRFAQLPSPTLVRGYYRAYAEELGIEPEQLISQYEVLTGQALPSAGVGALTSLKPWQRKFVWLTLAAFAIGIALVVFATRDSWMIKEEGLNSDSLLGQAKVTEQLISKNAVDQKANTGVLYGSDMLKG